MFEKEAKLKLLSLGGIGTVTKNMFVYEYKSDIIIVDCGVGFPAEGMYGVDLIIPDIDYLIPRRGNIRAIILTHAHDDHIGALPYLLPQLKAPVYATTLTAGFAQSKLAEFNIKQTINIIKTSDVLNLGSFYIKFVHVTHSVPDAINLIIKTPIGSFYHGSDYKFDWTPIDNWQTEIGKIARIQDDKVLCLLSDCVRIEKEGYTLSERFIKDSFEREISNCEGKFIMTTQSSNIARIQLAIDTATKFGRKVCFIGRSIRQNTEIAEKLSFLKYPKKIEIPEKKIPQFRGKDLCLIVAGSQGQSDSALVRIANGENKYVKIKNGDIVVFSADPIPGNESQVHELIDALTQLEAGVSYSEILDDLHVSGHGSKNDIAMMIALVGAKYLIPIGGTPRQMRQFVQLAQNMGYKRNTILLPDSGQIIEFSQNGEVNLSKKVHLKNVMIDGLGIGDVGSLVLRDRQKMAVDGIVVVVLPIDQDTGKLTAEPDIISRGFVYMRESGELINGAKQRITKSIKEQKTHIRNWSSIRKKIQKDLQKYLYNKTHRNPMILPMVIEV